MLNLAAHEFNERDLIRRVMLNLRARNRFKTARWVLVMKTFGVGSTVARALCLEFDMNPDEELNR